MRSIGSTLPARSCEAVTSLARRSNSAVGSEAAPSTVAVPDTVPSKPRSGRTAFATSRPIASSVSDRSRFSPAVPDARNVPSPTWARRSFKVTVLLATVMLVGALNSNAVPRSLTRSRSSPTRNARAPSAGRTASSPASSATLASVSGVPKGDRLPAISAVAEPLIRALASKSVTWLVPLADASSVLTVTPPATTPSAFARPSTSGTPNASDTVAEISALATRAAFTMISRRAPVTTIDCSSPVLCNAMFASAAPLASVSASAPRVSMFAASSDTVPSSVPFALRRTSPVNRASPAVKLRSESCWIGPNVTISVFNETG